MYFVSNSSSIHTMKSIKSDTIYICWTVPRVFSTMCVSCLKPVTALEDYILHWVGNAIVAIIATGTRKQSDIVVQSSIFLKEYHFAQQYYVV